MGCKGEDHDGIQDSSVVTTQQFIQFTQSGIEAQDSTLLRCSLLTGEKLTLVERLKTW